MSRSAIIAPRSSSVPAGKPRRSSWAQPRNRSSSGSPDSEAGDLSSAYADATGYTWPGGSGGGGGVRSPLTYQASGSMNRWMGENGFASLLVELSTPRATEIERNLSGLKAALAVLAGAT